MRVTIHFFSGAGNTARAVSIIAKRLERSGHTVQCLFIDKDAVPPSVVSDLTVIAYPTYSWAAPSMVKRYARQMPRSNGTRASIFTTRGGSPDPQKDGGFAGQGLEEMARILRKRGYDVALTMDAPYPDTWIQAVNPPAGEEAGIIIARGDAEAERFAQAILSGERSLYRCGAFHTAWSKTIAILFSLAGRRMLGKMFIADRNCTSCGICAKTCPSGTISLEGADQRPSWGTNCENCCRCINTCPENAIQFSVPLLVTHLGVQILSFVICAKVGRTAGAWSVLRRRSPVLAFTAAFAAAKASAFFLFMLQMVPLDRILFALSGHEKLRDFFCWSHTQGFNRYKAPGFKPLAPGLHTAIAPKKQ